MALQIPMPELPLSGLNKAIGTGGNLFQQMMNPVIQRENMQRQWKEHLDNLAIQKQQQSRLAQTANDAHKLAQYNITKAERENKPEKMYEYMQQWDALKNKIMGARNQGQENTGTNNPLIPGNQNVPTQPQNYGNQPSQPGQTINIGGSPMPLDLAQQLQAMKAPIPGLADSLKNYYELQKQQGTAEAKEHVKRQSERGDQFSSVQTGLEQVGRINQIMENYAKEAKEKGYSPHYGAGAELRTDPNVLHRAAGRTIQRFAHPLEAITHPLDLFEAVGAQSGSKVHEKYLSELRGELNNLVNAQAKNLNSKFTQKEYEVLLANKPSISDSEDVLRGKLKAITNSMVDAAKKLYGQNISSGQTNAGNEPFLSENSMPSEQSGRETTGQYKTDIEKPFVDPKNPVYEYFEQNGKYYRRKRKK